MDRIVMNAITAGIIAAVLGIVATFAVDLLVESDDLDWAIFAVAFASFFGGAASYYSGEMPETTEVHRPMS